MRIVMRDRSAPVRPPSNKEYKTMKAKLLAIRRRPPDALYTPRDLEELRRRLEHEKSENLNLSTLSTQLRPGDRGLAALRAQGFETRMSEAIRNRPARPFVYTPLNKATSSHDVDKDRDKESEKEVEKAPDKSKAKDKEKEKGGAASSHFPIVASPFQESKEAYRKMKDKVHAVYQRPFVVPRPAPLSYDERMKKEKLFEEKQKQDEERRKANKALMAKVDAIAARPTPVYRVKYVYT